MLRKGWERAAGGSGAGEGQPRATEPAGAGASPGQAQGKQPARPGLWEKQGERGGRGAAPEGGAQL